MGYFHEIVLEPWCNDIEKPPMDAVIRRQSTDNSVPELLRKGLPAWSHFRSRDEKLPSFWSTNRHMSPRGGLAGWLAGRPTLR